MTTREQTLLIGGAVLLALFYWKRKEVVTVAIDTAEKVKNALAPRGIRNNNPGNLRHGEKWQGMAAEQTDAAFITFISPEYGIRAMVKLFATYRDRYGLTSIRDIITRYAPSSENNTEAYIAAVAKEIGMAKDANIGPDDMPGFITAVIRHENGQQPYSAATIAAGIALV
jgi:hypothetical protein